MVCSVILFASWLRFLSGLCHCGFLLLLLLRVGLLAVFYRLDLVQCMNCNEELHYLFAMNLTDEGIFQLFLSVLQKLDA